uniref:EGF-like domain-containing protein n=1 Tax=Rhodnius prolixus TaxID=13249 RepID=T1HWU2_RHOPR
MENNTQIRCEEYHSSKLSRGYGASCIESVQCSTKLEAGGQCNNSICNCAEGFHYFKGQCWKTSGLTQPCKHDSNCFVSNDFEASICNNVKNICECSPGYYQREYSSCRRISEKPGESCGIPLDCKYPNATCTRERTCGEEGKALEPKDKQEEVSFFVENIRKRRKRTALATYPSLGSKKIGANCKNNTECPKNSECYKESLCLCLKGFYTTDNSTCYPELGSRCEEDGDCKGKNTMCRNNKYCTCKQGFVATQDSRQCDKMSRNINWSCLRDEECGFFGPGGKCISKKCHCSNETHWVSEQLFCWVNKKVGESCTQSEDCGGRNSSMICTDDKVCACIPDAHPSSTGTSCRKDSKQVGQPCYENLDCIYTHAECNITLHVCTCQRGYLENKTVCVAGINGTCKSNEDCNVKNSHCNNNTCVCIKNFVSNQSLNKCLALATTVGSKCSEPEQCNLLSGDCIQGVCNCRNGSYFVPKDKKCYVKSIINQNCTREQNCSVLNSECLRNICKCKRGYEPRENFTMCINNGAGAAMPLNLLLITGTLLAFIRLKSKNMYKIFTGVPMMSILTPAQLSHICTR